MVQDPIPRSHGLIQRSQVAGLQVALHGLHCLAEIVFQRGGHGRPTDLGKCSFHAHLAAAAQQSAVLFQHADEALGVPIGRSVLHPCSTDGFDEAA